MNPSTSTRFLALRPTPTNDGHRPGCRCRTCQPREQVETDQFAAMLLRMIRAFEARVIDDPNYLPLAAAVRDRAAEVVTVAVAVNADRYAVDPRSGVSMLECMRILGLKSKATASDYRARGVAAMNDRIDRAGAARFAEAKRERDLIAAAAEVAVVQLADYRARRAS